MSNVETINIDKIRTDGGTQSRAAINDEVVSEYADAIRAGTDFPPVTLYFDGREYWLADGFHRTEAYIRAGAVEIAADVRQGDRRSAILHSVGANASHGLRRTGADKRRAVETLLRDEVWSTWSQRKIAEHCGVSQQYVSKIANNGNASYNSSSKIKTVERGGRTYEIDTSNIGGKKPEPEPVLDDDDDVPPGPLSGPAEPLLVADDPAPEPEPRKPSPYANLTREALEDDLAAVMEENEALKAEIAKRDAEIERLTDLNKLLSADGQGATISQLERRRITAVGQMRDYQAAVKREEYKRRKAEERVAELEAMGIAI